MRNIGDNVAEIFYYFLIDFSLLFFYFYIYLKQPK